MKIGATAAYTYAFRGTGMSLEDYLDSIATLPQLGLNYFDLEILQPQHIPIYEDPDNAARLHDALAEHGVNIAGFTSWLCLEHIHSLDPARHQIGFELFERVASLASKFGAHYMHLGSDMFGEFIQERDEAYVTAPALQLAVPEKLSLPKVVDEYAGRLAKLAAIAEDHGLKFAVEPRANSILYDAHSFQSVWQQAAHDNLYCCLDVVHMAYHRLDVPLAIELLGDRLLVMQLCNARGGQMLHLPLDDGDVAINPIVSTLNKADFDGFLMLELYRGGNDQKDDVDQWYRDGVATLQPLLGVG